MKAVILSTLLASATIAGSTEERLQTALGDLSASIGVGARRRKPSSAYSALEHFAQTTLCQGGMVVGEFLGDTKRLLKETLTGKKPSTWENMKCEELKHTFLSYIDFCDLTGNNGAKKTVYAGRTVEGGAIGGMSRTFGAFLDSDGHTGCFVTTCGSVGLQLQGSGGFSVGVVHDDYKNGLDGWAAGIGSSLDLGFGFDINAGKTIPGGVLYVESGASLGLGENAASGYVCKTTTYQDEVNKQREHLIQQWAEINKETGHSWNIGHCTQKGGHRIPLSKGSDLAHMVDCLNKCRAIKTADACEMVFSYESHKTPGCYYFTAPVTRTDHATSAMCYQDLHPGTCTDTPGWKDSDGDTCAVYENKEYCKDGRRYDGWNTYAWGNIRDFQVNGVDAHEACCVCGKPASM